MTFTVETSVNNHVDIWVRSHFIRNLYDTIRYDTRRYFNVRSKANMSQLNLPHGTDN